MSPSKILHVVQVLLRCCELISLRLGFRRNFLSISPRMKIQTENFFGILVSMRLAVNEITVSVMLHWVVILCIWNCRSYGSFTVNIKCDTRSDILYSVSHVQILKNMVLVFIHVHSLPFCFLCQKNSFSADFLKCPTRY
jgi:hypothetical protein